MVKRQQIAIYGGSFDPPTIAHEAIMEACLARPEIDAVWVLPSADRQDKTCKANADERVDMLECIKQDSFLSKPLCIDDREAFFFPQPTRTWKTVDILEKLHTDCSFWFVHGTDSYHDMPRWQHGKELQGRLHFLLAPRIGYDMPPESERIRHIGVGGMPQGLSSTEVRNRIQRSETIVDLVCSGVQKYIEAGGLYR